MRVATVAARSNRCSKALTMSQLTSSFVAPFPSLVRPQDAARLLGLSVSTLAKLRISGQGPAFCKLGSRAVAYRVEDLRDWLNGRTRTSTSDAGRYPPR